MIKVRRASHKQGLEYREITLAGVNIPAGAEQSSENSAFLIREESGLFSGLALQFISRGGREGRRQGWVLGWEPLLALGPWAWLGSNPLGPGTPGALTLTVLPQGLCQGVKVNIKQS